MQNVALARTDLVSIKGSLEREAELLRHSILQYQLLSRESTSNKGGDFADLGAALAEQSTNMTISQYLKSQLEQNKEALRRLKQGKYGVCQRCGHPINPERLEVLPNATLCVDCKRLTES